MLKSVVCREEHFRSEWFRLWVERMGFPTPATQHMHRKVWEWSAIAQALFERGVLRKGMRGLGFAVGTEPLVSLFAALGATVEATDLFAGEAAEFWKGGDQYAVSKDALFRSDLIDREEFDKRVNFYNADMNDLSSFHQNSYDFIWSSCAVEHVGSLEKAKKFLSGAMDLLKPGGVSVHTTEFNVSSLTELYEDGETIIFREQDLLTLDREVRLKRSCIETLDTVIGSERLDVDYDVQPFSKPHHIKLELNGYIVTSIVLIFRKFG